MKTWNEIVRKDVLDSGDMSSNRLESISETQKASST